MSHDYNLSCKCGAHSPEDYNNGQLMLATAVEESWALMRAVEALKGTAWYGQFTYGVCADSLAAFIVQHYACGGFLVVSEYYSPGDPDREAKYPPIHVVPKAPEGEYRAACLRQAVEDGRAVVERLTALLADEQEEAKHG